MAMGQNETSRGQQVLDVVSISRGSILGAFDPHLNGGFPLSVPRTFGEKGTLKHIPHTRNCYNSRKNKQFQISAQKVHDPNSQARNKKSPRLLHGRARRKGWIGPTGKGGENGEGAQVFGCLRWPWPKMSQFPRHRQRLSKRLGKKRTV